MAKHSPPLFFMYRSGTCDINIRFRGTLLCFLVFKRIENRSVSSRQRVFLLSTPFTNGMPSKEAFMKRTIALGFVMVVTLMLVSGCNTIRGAGEDLQQGGEAIQRAAS